MGKARRRRYVEADYIPGYLLDAVTYGTKLGYVAQEDGHWPPYAEVIIPRRVQRQPRLLTRGGSTLGESGDIFDRLGKVWCSWCAEWVDREKFGKDSRKKNGLKTHCLKCEAKQRQINRLSARIAATGLNVV